MNKVKNKSFRFRIYKYAILSLVLLVILIVMTGCTAFLFGDNKKAYDFLIKASEYFKYPSSIQIESGEVYGEGMYCVIKGRNSYGNYRSSAYYISSSGYPLDDYDSRCYSDKLNVDLINIALSAHFGNSSGNVINYVIGGNKMASGGVIAIYIVVLIVILCVNGYLASNASDMASEKGYEKRKWFHMCFWLGPISYIIIASMPDRTMRSKQDKTNKLLETIIESMKNTSDDKKIQNPKDDVSIYLPEL